MVSEEYRIGLEKFKKRMRIASKTLPKNWVRIILDKKELSLKNYRDQYTMLVNFRSGRSYRSSLKRGNKVLVKEIIELSKKYKELEL